MQNGVSNEAMMPTAPQSPPTEMRHAAGTATNPTPEAFDDVLYTGVRTSMDVLRTNLRNLAIVAVTLNASTIGVYMVLHAQAKEHPELLGIRQTWPLIGMAIVLVFMSVYRQRFRELGQYIFECLRMERLRKSKMKGTGELATENHRYGPGTYFKTASADSAAIMSGVVWTLAMIYELKVL